MIISTISCSLEIESEIMTDRRKFRLRSLPADLSMEAAGVGTSRRTDRQMVRQTTFDHFASLNDGELDATVKQRVDEVIRDRCGPSGDKTGEGLTALEIAAILKKKYDFSEKWKIRKRPNSKSEDRCLYSEVRRCLEHGCSGDKARFMKLSDLDGRYTLSYVRP